MNLPQDNTTQLPATVKGDCTCISSSHRHGRQCASADAADIPLSTNGNTCPASMLISDEEIVILHLRPSILYIPLTSLGSIFAIVFFGLLLAYLSRINLPYANWSEYNVALLTLLLIGARLLWQTADWWSRTYVLTDRRVIATWGVFRRCNFQASLRHIQHIAVVQSIRERIFKLGTIAFATAGSDSYDAGWLILSKPYEVHRKIVDTIDRYGRHHPE